MRARQSISSVPPVPSSEAALVFSVSSLEPVCVSKKTMKKVGGEVSYLVTAELFENREDDWLATGVIQASCTCRGEHQKAMFWTSVHSFEQLKARRWISGSAVM